MIDPIDCCAICFNVLAHDEYSPCQECRKIPQLYHRMGAVFDYQGPASSLIQSLKYGNQPYLAKGMAAFLFAQIQNLQWPLPDALVPVPLSWMRWLQRGYNQTHLIAEELSLFIQRPVLNVLGRRSGDHRQAMLNYQQRQTLKSENFQLLDHKKIQDKVIWVIDDVMTTGTTLRCCAETLCEAGPKHLYGLTFCRTLQF